MTAQKKPPPEGDLDETANAVATARSRLGLTQSAFAQLLETPLGTVRGWEQGRRTPPPCAMLLMRIAVEHPHAVMSVSKLDSGQTAFEGKPVPARSTGKAPAEEGLAADLHEPGDDADFWLL